MKISDVEKEIIQWIQHRAQEPISSAAKALRLREHVIRRVVSRLQNDHILRLQHNPIDMSRLGYLTCNLLFALHSNSPKSRALLEEGLRNTEGIGWAVEVGGDYQYEITLLAENMTGASNVLSTLFMPSELRISRKQLVMEHHQFYFGVKFRDVEDDAIPVIEMCHQEKCLDIDQTDLEVVSILSKSAFKSVAELARELGMPVSSLQYRRQCLEDKGVVLPRKYSIDLSSHGYARSHILISCSMMAPHKKREFFNYCKRAAGIYGLIAGTGAWDYKIIAVADGTNGLKSILDSLQARFSDEIISVSVVPCFNVLRLEYYPLKPSFLLKKVVG